jgi:TolA-binding protein
LKLPTQQLAAIILLCLPPYAATADESANLEARLKETAEASQTGAALMLQLIDLYKKDGQVFGLIRTASKFARSQQDHPRRAEVMLNLLDSYAATARHDDIITSAKQFLEILPDHALANEARDRLATAYERTGRATLGASQRATIWRNGGTTEQGIRALKTWIATDKPQAYSEATLLAGEMVTKLTPGSTWSGLAIQGMQSAIRCEKWADGLQIAKTVAKRGGQIDSRSAQQIAFLQGRCESQLGQHSNAVASFRKSLTDQHSEAHRYLIEAMIAATAKPPEIEAEARRYLAAFPRRDDRYDPLARSAKVAAEAGDTARALVIANDVMQNDVNTLDISRAYIEWCGKDHQLAAKGLLNALEKNPAGAPKLRALLVLDVYRDRMKDVSKSREMARLFLAESPSEEGWTEEVVKFLYDSAPSNEAFNEDLAAVIASAKTFPHLAGFQDRVWNPAPADKERNRVWQIAKKDYLGDSVTKLWRQTLENGGKSGQACTELLGKKGSSEVRHYLLARLAYVYRHHLGGKSSEVSAKHYETLCKEFPKDLEAAERWLETSFLTGKEMQLAAARHLLSFTPSATHPDTWIRLCNIKDETILRKALPWITESSKKSDSPLYHSPQIGDIMSEIGMKVEAATWWRSRMDLDPGNRDAVSCALKYADTMKTNEVLRFLMQRFETSTDHQGIYAAQIADLNFKAGDFASMEKILTASHARTEKNPFQSSSMSEWPARGWLEAARNSKEMPDETKTRVYRMIRDIKAGRLSAEAGMLLIPSEPHDLGRLLKTQKLILMAEPHHESWDRLFPFAQTAMAREDYTLAAAIINGLLNSIRSVGEKQMADARTLLRKAYGKMGSLSADIPADSPIAPLLQIVLHLRLGETELAEKAYYQNKELFDAHRAELPVELLLFGAETHIAQGTPEDHERAEEILRGWLMKFGGAENVDVREKARIQLLLARNYQSAKQYDIARAEFTTVLNIHKDQPEAIEAKFGIGETYMAQKVYDQASEIFTDLAENPVPSVAVRANFLLGILSLRQDDNDGARRIFLSVLDNTPDSELANETLYNLAEVYGIEQRFLTQLETLRTVGRLGQESKQWQTPGNALPIVVQDPDLGISRGDTRIPVVVRTEPGNDLEKSFLSSGGAGKGIFLSEIPTELGEAKPGDGVLQVTGGDVITVDYPEDFKKQFQFEFLGNTRLRIASDGSLEVASSEIINKQDESFTDTLKQEVEDEDDDEPKPRAATRPDNQIKPGNFIYAQIKDGDRDLTAEPDKISIRLTTSSGDEVSMETTEVSHHGGVFQGAIRTGELPAGAKASDSALDHSPLMSIDHDPVTSWRSEPDGAAPKSLSVDMKELRAVETITLTSPEATNEAPIRMRVRGSNDGRMWFDLAHFPTPPEVQAMNFSDPTMQLRVYKSPLSSIRETYTWNEILEMTAKNKPTDTTQVETLSWEIPERDEDAYFLIWSGPLVQERDGAMRLSVSGKVTAIMLDGRLVLAPGVGGRTVDVFASRGIHKLTVYSIATPKEKAVEVLRARENLKSADVKMHPFAASDFDPKALPGLPKIEKPEIGEITQKDHNWILKTKARELRHIDFEFLEYRGEAIAVSNVEISGGGVKHIPPVENVLELADNDILELAPGDTVRVSYLDELTAGGKQPNRLLEKLLTATYYNGSITPISYDFARSGDGSVQGSRKELLRIEPGERIVAEVVDFDLDTGLGRDTVEVTVQLNGENPFKVLATESGPSTGVFLAEIDTAAEIDGNKLVVKQGDKVYLRYRDTQNTFPGHASDREAVVLLNHPTDGLVRILESEAPFGREPVIIPAAVNAPADHVGKVEYRMPLTVEVIDPDQAKDSNSTVTVEITTTQGATAMVECKLSRAFASANETLDESRNPALFEGRFVGQIPLLLGETITTAKPSAPEDLETESDTNKDKSTRLVLNSLGNDIFTARYQDVSRQTKLEAKASLASAAKLHITDSEYLEDAEIVYVGTKIYLLLEDPDLDISPERDKALILILTESGEDETVEVEETLSHSGIFSGSFPLVASTKPVKRNFKGEIECNFGDVITAGYLDNVEQTPDGLTIIERKIPVAMGTDGEMAAFSKIFKNEELAIQTQFHIAESQFELFKGHRALKDEEESAKDLAAGKRVLRQLQEDYPDPKYAPRVAYLLGQFAQEMKTWDEAIAAYRTIVTNHPEHYLAADAQYKLGQCYEEAGELDEALEAYVTLAATYPKSPLIANVMLRINEHFYTKEEYAVAASVGTKFIERFPNHEWAPKMAFRIGQCYFKLESYAKAGPAFDDFVKSYSEHELTAQALFWAGESYRSGKDIPEAFRRYNRCRWDFPESDAAKYSRGRLALPELLAQFEREANLNE